MLLFDGDFKLLINKDYLELDTYTMLNIIVLPYIIPVFSVVWLPLMVFWGMLNIIFAGAFELVWTTSEEIF